jgi:hypothetical protein
MVAEASNGGADAAPGLSSLDASLLRSVAEIAAKNDASPELQSLAKALIGVIQMQADMAQCLSQFMQLLSQENRKETGT